ncbi:uncharacterized protein LOC113213498 isoform X1 [Frankliniella occidentalis]|uniref:Uncharacterized protein LOC113213498 isoform X1 n=1 Tax=Frankliniella occidentalis TaxID=133901 RepID=A0A6J1T613_FRAOC|nr:uncharacterized protein LOC113213498 isoform X1 [Frankliniella occidentalis]
MACCVVLNQPSAEVPVDVSVDQPASVISTTCSQSTTLNTDGSGSFSSNKASTDSRSNNTDNISTSQAPSHVFKEPWGKLLAQAKNKLRKNRPREHNPKINVITYTLNQTPRQLDVLNNEPQEAQLVEKTSIKKTMSPTEKSKTRTRVKNDLQTTQSCASEQEETSKRTRRGKRSSSVEWDWSGNDSDTTTVPQNKRRKTRSSKKRTPSIDSSWIKSEDDDDVLDEMEESRGSPGSTHKCLLCDKTFSRPWRLRTHLYRHIKIEGPYTCDFEGCSKSYFHKAHLVRHKSRNHSDLVASQQIKCPEEDCSKLFRTGSGLKRHINKEHSGENLKFPCPHCDQSFPKNKQLRYHIAEHDGQPPLRCAKCNAGAYTDNMLRRHMRSHKEYPCDVPGCEQVFSNYSAFRKHKNEHSKCFQSLECAHCKQTFTTKFNLRQHVLTHLTEKQVFKCTYESCDRVYYQNRNLQSHIRLKHERKSNFACPWSDCVMIFMSKRALWKHISVHENGPAKPVKKKENRATRKDKGKPKKAMATMLAGMMVPAQVEKQLLKESSSFKMSESEPEDGPARSTRSRSKVDIPLLIAGSSIQCDSSEGITNTSQHINDMCSVNITSSVLVDNSIIEYHAGREYELSDGGFLVEVPLVEKISGDLDAGQAGVAVEPSEPQTFDEDQPNYLLGCEDRRQHSSDAGPAPVFVPNERVQLCAETIVECKSTDAEKEMLVIPKLSQYSITTDGASVVNRDSVVQTLRSVSDSDPSVSGILQPLIEKLIDLPNETFQDTAKTSFANINLMEVMNDFSNMGRIKNPAYSPQEFNKEKLSPQTNSAMVRNPAYDESMDSKQAGVTLLDKSSLSDIDEPQNGEASHDEIQNNEGPQGEHPNDESQSDSSVSRCSTDCTCCTTDKIDSEGTPFWDKMRSAEQPLKIEGTSKSQEKILMMDKTSNSCVASPSRDESVGKELVCEQKLNHQNSQKNKEKKPIHMRDESKGNKPVCEQNVKHQNSLNTKGKKPIHMRDESKGNKPVCEQNVKHQNSLNSKEKKPIHMRDESKGNKLVCEQDVKHQNSLNRKGKKPIHKIQSETKYSFDSSDSEPLSEWFKKQNKKSAKRKVISNDNFSDSSISSCFESRPSKKKPKVLNFSETDSDDPLDPSWKPGTKKSRPKVIRRISSESDSESNTDKSETSISLLPEHTESKPSRLPGIHEVALEEKPKRSGLACRQLSESTWLDILRQVNRSVKLSMSAIQD